MRKSLLLLFMVLVSSVGYTQYAFHRLYGGDEFDYGYDIVELPDSGFFVTGMSGSYTPGHAQAFLMRLDKNGVKQWIVPYGGIENDAGLDLEYKENFGTYLLGRTTSSNGDFDMWISLLDDQGGVQWERTYPAPDWEEAVESEMTQDNGLIVAVHRFGTGTQDQDASLIRLDAQGDTVWVQEFNVAGNDEITKIASYQDSLFVVSSNHLDSVTGKDFALLQVIHEDGSLLWDDTIGVYPGNSYLNDFYLSGDTLYGVGASKLDDTSTYNRLRHIHRLSLAENGDILTDVSISAGNMIEDVVARAHGLGFIYSSFRFQDPMGLSSNYDFYLGLNSLQLTPIGAAANTVTDGEDLLYEAIPTLDSGTVFVGYQSLASGGTAVVVMKIGNNIVYPTIPENPLVTPILGQEENDLLPSVSIYPNPTQGEINIKIEEGTADQFTIVNLEGKVLLSGGLFGDSTKVDTSSLSKGIYLIQLFNEADFLGAKRIIVD
ncbi:MAG: hypothetical protein Crog4KO_32870 [Crocinitomicaceae bacterium]